MQLNIAGVKTFVPWSVHTFRLAAAAVGGAILMTITTVSERFNERCIRYEDCLQTIDYMEHIDRVDSCALRKRPSSTSTASFTIE